MTIEEKFERLKEFVLGYDCDCDRPCYCIKIVKEHLKRLFFDCAVCEDKKGWQIPEQVKRKYFGENGDEVLPPTGGATVVFFTRVKDIFYSPRHPRRGEKLTMKEEVIPGYWKPCECANTQKSDSQNTSPTNETSSPS